MILVQKVQNLRLISGEDLFFRDHYNFGAKNGMFRLFGPPIFSMSQNGPRLKKVGHPCLKEINVFISNQLNLLVLASCQ